MRRTRCRDPKPDVNNTFIFMALPNTKFHASAVATAAYSRGATRIGARILSKPDITLEVEHHSMHMLYAQCTSDRLK